MLYLCMEQWPNPKSCDFCKCCRVSSFSSVPCVYDKSPASGEICGHAGVEAIVLQVTFLKKSSNQASPNVFFIFLPKSKNIWLKKMNLRYYSWPWPKFKFCLRKWVGTYNSRDIILIWIWVGGWLPCFENSEIFCWMGQFFRGFSFSLKLAN